MTLVFQLAVFALITTSSILLISVPVVARTSVFFFLSSIRFSPTNES